MNDVNPEGGGEASRENPIDDALGGTIQVSSQMFKLRANDSHAKNPGFCFRRFAGMKVG